MTPGRHGARSLLGGAPATAPEALKVVAASRRNVPAFVFRTTSPWARQRPRWLENEVTVCRRVVAADFIRQAPSAFIGDFGLAVGNRRHELEATRVGKVTSELKFDTSCQRPGRSRHPRWPAIRRADEDVGAPGRPNASAWEHLLSPSRFPLRRPYVRINGSTHFNPILPESGFFGDRLGDGERLYPLTFVGINSR
jgi:hypothetical protein